MARVYEPTAENEAEWQAWVASTPEPIRRVAQRFYPWELYRLKSTGQRVTLASFYEIDGEITLRVNITGDYNLVLFDRTVFGIKPSDLEPCELPSEQEMLGAALSQEEVDDNIDIIRVLARPDLWFMDEDGKARWRH
jgi:hypothetical protein